MASVIEQIRNRLSILFATQPLLPIVSRVNIPGQKEGDGQMADGQVADGTPPKVVYPERFLSLEVANIEPKQDSMPDVVEVSDSFKPDPSSKANKRTTGIFRPKIR